ncbi:MAG: tetratricopeptide repeat protein, partial [Ectothiorhodospira sp.]
GAEAAREVLESGLEASPDNARLLMLMAEFEVEQGEPDEAGQFLQRAVDAEPEALEPRVVLARYHLQTGEPESALSVLEGVDERHEDDAALLEVLSMAQVSAGRLDQGITTLRRLAELRPDSPEVHFRLALAQGQAERFGEARRSLERVLEQDEEHPGALLTLARLERREGREDQALELARRMQGLDAVRARGYLLEGDILATREDYAGALEAYEASYRERATGEGAMKRFEVLRRAEGGEAAREWMREHLEEYPDDHRSRMVLATSLLEAGDRTAAREEYERLEDRFPEDPMVLNNLSYIYQQEGDARALDLAQKAHELQPEDPRIQDTLGMAMLEHGDPAEGLEWIGEAREALPDDASIGYHHAVALERNGRPDEAASVLRELLDEAGEFAERQEAEALLRRLES